jgi:hypothetical protein
LTSSAIRQLQFVSQNNDLATISEETGISPSSLLFSLSGDADINSSDKQALKNFYMRDAYDRLREAGLSSVQANRFKWYAPEMVLSVEMTMQDDLMNYAMGVLASRTRSIEGQLTFEEISGMYADAYNDVKKGFQESKKTVEDFQNY